MKRPQAKLSPSQSLLAKWLSGQCTARLSFLAGTCSYASPKSGKGGVNPKIPIWIQGTLDPKGHSVGRDAKDRGTPLVLKMASYKCPSGEGHKGQVGLRVFFMLTLTSRENSKGS